MNDDGSVMIAEPLFSPNTKPRAPNPDSYPRSSVDPFRGFRGFRGVRGLWGLGQAATSSIDFDFAEYSAQRFEQYWSAREQHK